MRSIIHARGWMDGMGPGSQLSTRSWAGTVRSVAVLVLPTLTIIYVYLGRVRLSVACPGAAGSGQWDTPGRGNGKWYFVDCCNNGLEG